MKWPSHGSNPHYLYKAAGLEKPDQLLDFSANINPLGPPNSIKENWNNFFQGIGQYPDPHTASLKRKLADREGIGEEQILIGNGGSQIISLVGRLFQESESWLLNQHFLNMKKRVRLMIVRFLIFSCKKAGKSTLTH